MFPLTLPLSVAIIMSPQHDDGSLDHLWHCHKAAQRIAVSLEILDPREVKYHLASKESFLIDANTISDRFRDLYGAPPSHDSVMFPSREILNDLMMFNRGYYSYANLQMNSDTIHWWEWREALNETDKLHELYSAIRDSKADYYYITVRRKELKKVRDIMGYEAYYSGALPPVVPLCRFRVIY